MKRLSRRIRVSAVALGTVASVLSVTQSPALAEAGPVGALCGFTAATDPNPEAPDDTSTGYIDAGPAVGTPGIITCTVKAGVGNHAGTTPNSASASTSTTSDLVVLPPTLVSFVSPSEDPVYLCSQWTSGSGTLFWDVETGFWSPSGDAACGLAISFGADDPAFDPVEDVIESVDPVLCPLLAMMAGTYGVVEVTNEGDVYVAGEFSWDCPPYYVSLTPSGPKDKPKGHQNKQTTNPDTAPEPDPEPVPAYPTGTITIKSDVPGVLSHTTPSGWSCNKAGLVATCTPPPAAAGYENRCGTLQAHAKNGAGGAVTASTRCTGGPPVSATSFGPATGYTTSTAWSGAPFPWTCEATVQQTIPGPWEIQCVVG